MNKVTGVVSFQLGKEPRRKTPLLDEHDVCQRAGPIRALEKNWNALKPRVEFLERGYCALTLAERRNLMYRAHRDAQTCIPRCPFLLFLCHVGELTVPVTPRNQELGSILA